MLIYKDILTGDEIVSDSYPISEVDGVIYEVDCGLITTSGVNLSIGAVASLEEADEALEDAEVKANDIIFAFRLQRTSFEKTEYLNYLKNYMKDVKLKLQEKATPNDEIIAFERGVRIYIREKFLPNFKDYEFLTGESRNRDGMVVLLQHREDGVTPYITMWKHGLEEMEV